MSSKRRLEQLAKYIACDVTSRILNNPPQDIKIDDITQIVYNHLQQRLYQLHFTTEHHSHTLARQEEIKYYEKRDVMYELARVLQEQEGLIHEEELTKRDRITSNKYSLIVLKKD